MEVRDQNVNKENREYPVKEDNRNIRESVRKNEKETDNPVGLEANPKVVLPQLDSVRLNYGSRS